MGLPVDCLPEPTYAVGYLLLAFTIGCLTGVAEILPRYKDEPVKAAFYKAGIIYWLLNGLLSSAAFLTVLLFFSDRFNLIVDGQWHHVHLLQATLLSGFGAMALARTKLFQVALPNGQSIAAGPEHVLNVLFESTNAYIAKYRMKERATLVEEKFGAVDFEKLKDRVVTLVVSARQSLSSVEQFELGEIMAKIAAAQIPPSEKSLRAGYVMLDYVGEQFLSGYDLKSLVPEPRSEASESDQEENIPIT